MSDTDDWRALRYDEAFMGTELGRLFCAYEHAMIDYWRHDANDGASHAKLQAISERYGEAANAFVAKLVELAESNAAQT